MTATQHHYSHVKKLVSRLDTDRDHANLSSTIQLYVLDYDRRLAELGLTVKQKRQLIGR